MIHNLDLEGIFEISLEIGEKNYYYWKFFQFLNFPVIFDLKPKIHFLVYLAKTDIQAKRDGRMLRGFDKSQFRIENICG